MKNGSGKRTVNELSVKYSENGKNSRSIESGWQEKVSTWQITIPVYNDSSLL